MFLGSIRDKILGKKLEDPKEAKLLLKLDWFILSYVCLIYWINYLDRSNLSNAYVSGMKEDLGMEGNQFNLINTCFNIGYIVALVPHNLILLKVRPRYWLSFCAFAWGILTLSIYKVTNFKQICAIRFFVAVFEAVTFSGTHLILGSFYEEGLLSFRTAIFTSSGLLGSIFSSTIQAAIYKNMDGYNGISGWRWLFIIDFLITIPVIIYGLIVFPDFPEVSKPWWMTEEEHQISLRNSKSPKFSKFDFSVLKRVFGNWKWYLFSLLWVLGGENESFGSNSIFALWLANFDYSVVNRNHYPMGVFGVGIAATIGLAIYLNCTGGRNHWHIGIFIAVAMIVSSIIFLSSPLSDAHVFASQYISGISYSGQTAFFAWANVICQDDLQQRAIILGSMNMFSNAVNAWWSLLFYAASDAPKFRKGCYAMLATAISSGILVVIMKYIESKEDKLKGEVITDEETGSVELTKAGPVKTLEVQVSSTASGTGTISKD